MTIVTVFRNRLKESGLPGYNETAPKIAAIAKTMPGYLSHKTFTAEDGERVTIVEFADEESQKRWSTEARHVEAKKAGRAGFYAEYDLKVCKVIRESTFKAP